MKNKLIIGAFLTGGVILLAIVIAGAVTMYKGDSGLVGVGKRSNTEQFFKTKEVRVIEDLFNEGDLDGAIAAAENILKSDPENTNVLSIYATCLLQKGNVVFEEDAYGKKGLAVSEKIIKLNPRSEKGYFTKGYAYEIMQDYNGALKAYQQYARIKEDASIFNQIGHVYDLMGNNSKAEEFYARSLELDQGSLATKMNIARSKYNHGEYQKALEDFRAVFNSADDKHLKSEAAYMMSNNYLMLKDIQNANFFAEKAILLDPTYPMVYVGMGQVLFAQDKLSGQEYEDNAEKAYNYFNKAIELNINQTIAYVLKGRLLAFSGDKKSAAKAYFQALDVVNIDITLMQDAKERLKKEIEEDIAYFKLERPGALTFMNIIKGSIMHKTYAIKLQFHYEDKDAFDNARAEWNKNLKRGEWGHSINEDGTCANGLRITWGSPPPPPPPPCVPSWGSWGACNKNCGSGVQTRGNGCGGSQSQACNTFACPSCGTANEDSYEKTSEVVAAERCAPSNTLGSWVDNSGLASAGGLAWTWKCNRNNLAVNCKAYKKGECGYTNSSTSADGVTVNTDGLNVTTGADGVTVNTSNSGNPPYNNRDDACRFGAFNSVKLAGGILHWKCGTGDSAKHVGDFFSLNVNSGDSVAVDYYGPKTGGVDCQCTPVYEYSCINTGVYIGTCNNNCNGNKEEKVQAIKRDIKCFPNENLLISKAEYNTATGKHCVNKTINCPACGSQNSEGGNYHETN